MKVVDLHPQRHEGALARVQAPGMQWDGTLTKDGSWFLELATGSARVRLRGFYEVEVLAR